MSRHHNIIWKRSVIQTTGQQIKTQIIIHCLRISLTVPIDAHQQSWGVIHEPFKRSFASCLLLRTVLVNHSTRSTCYLSNLMANLRFFLSLHVSSTYLFVSLLTHKHKLLISNAWWLVGIQHILSEKLGWWLTYLSISISFDIWLREIPNMNSIKNILLGQFAVHGNFILVCAHLIEFFVPELALTVWPYQH